MQPIIPTNTLAAYEALPQKHRVDLRQVPISKISEATKAYRVNCGQVSSETRALAFYCLNHHFHKLSARFTPSESLPAWAFDLANGYREVLVEQGERLMHYMVSIITREARHVSAFSTTHEQKLIQIGGQEVYDFLNANRGSNETAAVNAYMNKPPVGTIGKYVRAIEYVFDKCHWSSTQYGGKPWGMIARTLGDFVEGKTSLEMMVDTAYTLAHNNGPMFNKGMMYESFDKNRLVTILDVQRAGQIPEFLHTFKSYSNFTHYQVEELRDYNDLAYKHMGGEYGEYVNWYEVEPSKDQDYKAFKKVQPGPKKDEPQKQTEGTWAKAKAEPFFKGKPAKEVGKWMVMPGQAVTEYQRIV